MTIRERTSERVLMSSSLSTKVNHSNCMNTEKQEGTVENINLNICSVYGAIVLKFGT